jgi:hypothetical protein
MEMSIVPKQGKFCEVSAVSRRRKATERSRRQDHGVSRPLTCARSGSVRSMG